MAKATLCDRCGKPTKDADVSNLDVELKRPGFGLTAVKEADLCPACAEIIVGVVENRIALEGSNPDVIVIGAPVKPAPTPRAEPSKAPEKKDEK